MCLVLLLAWLQRLYHCMGSKVSFDGFVEGVVTVSSS